MAQNKSYLKGLVSRQHLLRSGYQNTPVAETVHGQLSTTTEYFQELVNYLELTERLDGELEEIRNVILGHMDKQDYSKSNVKLFTKDLSRYMSNPGIVDLLKQKSGLYEKVSLGLKERLEVVETPDQKLIKELLHEIASLKGTHHDTAQLIEFCSESAEARHMSAKRRSTSSDDMVVKRARVEPVEDDDEEEQ